MGTFPDVHLFVAPCIVLKSFFLLLGRRSLTRSRRDPLQLFLGPSCRYVAWSTCHQDMESGSSAPNAGLFELGQLLAGTNSCPLARDNLINSSRFIHVHTSPTTSSKPDLAISPGYNRAPLVSAAPCFFCPLCSRFILHLRCSAGWFCSGVGESGVPP